MQIQPYLYFNGRCDEAIAFYREALGAEVQMLMRFKDAPPEAGTTPESADKVMHATLRIGETTVLVSDGRCFEGNAKFDGFCLSLAPSDDTEAERLWKALSTGGQVMMPFGPTFFASRFGMTTDRFGVPWMVISAPVAAPAR